MRTTRRPPPRPALRQSVVLIGFMGSGKSMVGRQVAGRLGYDFADSDTLVSVRAGMSIPEIFERHGEPWFRAAETRELERLTGRSGLVLATGGGVPTIPENIPILHRIGLIIWLTASNDVLWERVSRNKNRPLLHTEDPRATLEQLITARTPIYESIADQRIDSTHLRHWEAADAVIQALRNADVPA